MAFQDNLAELRSIASEQGYTLERAMMKNRWRLTHDKTRQPAVNQHGSTAFTITDAIKFLNSVKASRESR